MIEIAPQQSLVYKHLNGINAIRVVLSQLSQYALVNM